MCPDLVFPTINYVHLVRNFAQNRHIFWTESTIQLLAKDIAEQLSQAFHNNPQLYSDKVYCMAALQEHLLRFNQDEDRQLLTNPLLLAEKYTPLLRHRLRMLAYYYQWEKSTQDFLENYAAERFAQKIQNLQAIYQGKATIKTVLQTLINRLFSDGLRLQARKKTQQLPLHLANEVPHDKHENLNDDWLQADIWQRRLHTFLNTQPYKERLCLQFCLLVMHHLPISHNDIARYLPNCSAQLAQKITDTLANPKWAVGQKNNQLLLSLHQCLKEANEPIAQKDFYHWYRRVQLRLIADVLNITLPRRVAQKQRVQLTVFLEALLYRYYYE